MRLGFGITIRRPMRENREQIAACSELGVTLEEFIEIGLAAMKAIAGDIGL